MSQGKKTSLPLALDEWCYHHALLSGRMDHFDVIERAGALGAQGVGLDYFLLPAKAKKDPGLLAAALQKHALEPVLGFGLPFALPGVAFGLFGRQQKEFFAIARRCGAKVCRVVGGVVLPVKGLKPFHLSLGAGAELSTVSANLKTFCRRAAGQGMTVALEYHMDYTAGQMLQILERVNEPNFAFTLDTGNALHLGEDPWAVARVLAPHAAFTHLKDMVRWGGVARCVPLGEGEVPVAKIVGLLRQQGYAGLYCLENAVAPAQKHLEEDWARRGVDYLARLPVTTA